MKVKYKREKQGGGWELVPMRELIGTSLGKFMRDSKQPIVAAFFEERNDGKALDVPWLIISNNQEQVDFYSKTTKAVHSDHFLPLVANEVMPTVIIEVFDDSDFLEINTTDRQETLNI